MSHPTGLVALAVASMREAVQGSDAQDSTSNIPDEESHQVALLNDFGKICSFCLVQEGDAGSCSVADLMQHVRTAHAAMLAWTDTELHQQLLAQDVQRLMHGELLIDIPGLSSTDMTLLQNLQQDLLVRQQNTQKPDASKAAGLSETHMKQQVAVGQPHQVCSVQDRHIMAASLATSPEACTNCQDLGGQDQGHHHQDPIPQSGDLIPHQLQECSSSCSSSLSTVQPMLSLDTSVAALCHTADSDPVSKHAASTAHNTTCPVSAQETLPGVDAQEEPGLHMETRREADRAHGPDSVEPLPLIADEVGTDDLAWGSGGGSAAGEDKQDLRVVPQRESLHALPGAVIQTTNSSRSHSCSSTSDHLAGGNPAEDEDVAVSPVAKNITLAVDEVSEDGGAEGSADSGSDEEAEDVACTLLSPLIDSRSVRRQLEGPADDVEDIACVTGVAQQMQAVPGRLLSLCLSGICSSTQVCPAIGCTQAHPYADSLLSGTLEDFTWL